MKEEKTFEISYKELNYIRIIVNQATPVLMSRNMAFKRLCIFYKYLLFSEQKQTYSATTQTHHCRYGNSP